MRMITKLGLVAISLLAATVLGLSSTSVSAVTDDDGTTENTTQSDAAKQRAAELKEKAAERKAMAQAKLTETKLKVCEKRESVINTIMARGAVRGQKQLDLFTTISERVQKFYTDKGRTAANYDELVADVNAKKAAAQTAVDTLKSSSVSFNCDGTDPKGAAAGFLENQKAQTAALKEYKTSVKNLIVGVKSAQSQTGGEQ